MTNSSQLPSRALTKAASELGNHRRLIQNRGITLAGYKHYFRNTEVLPGHTTEEYATRQWNQDQRHLETLLGLYNHLQTERRRATCPVHADDANALDLAGLCTCAAGDQVRTDSLQALIEVHREWYGSKAYRELEGGESCSS